MSAISMAKRGLIFTTAAALFGLLAACGSSKPASMTKTYGVVDEDGKKAGLLVLSPMGSGELRDSDGRLIGRVTPP